MVCVDFGGWGTKYLLPADLAGELIKLMAKSVAIDTESVGNSLGTTYVYVPKDRAQITWQYIERNSIVLPANTPAKQSKEYVSALKATAELQGDNFIAEAMPFDAWLKAQSQ